MREASLRVPAIVSSPMITRASVISPGYHERAAAALPLDARPHHAQGVAVRAALLALVMLAIPACSPPPPVTVADMTLPCEPLPEGEPIHVTVALVDLPYQRPTDTGSRMWCLPSVPVVLGH